MDIDNHLISIFNDHVGYAEALIPKDPNPLWFDEKPITCHGTDAKKLTGNRE